ncbi:HIT domain-containing protein [Diaminobutyricibacter tongyongensis]|uniref:HIT domain-containing protein n=2 Tax=Leifsonia tongyongensis TaxID=1268043 RepID=A0A6L9XV79_9MICO|nr:HIT domain-containing protein [Diaminobutyricibacter tongyongensis]NEN05319.1 HIT domain-containing protein [Diaminobutyricibacter tongyongensis]
MVTGCPFCEIAERETPDTREVYRDRWVVAFFPTEPAVLGHTLVIPRRHVRDIWELDDELAHHIGWATLRLATAIRDATNLAGLNVIQSNGEAASQTVPHLHVHLVPRWDGDAIGQIWPPETSYTEGEKDRAWERVRNAAAHISE